MDRSDSIKELATALCKFQGELNSPKKNAKVNMKLKSGYNLSYKYSTFDDIMIAIKAPLSKNGLSFIQNVETNGIVKVSTLILHESGEYIETGFITFTCTDNNPQSMGSLITYGRRYSLSAALGISCTDDDDANSVTYSENEYPAYSQLESESKPDNNSMPKKKSIDIITEAQAKRLFAISKGNKDLVKQIICNYGYEHTKDILTSQYNNICEEIQKNIL